MRVRGNGDGQTQSGFVSRHVDVFVLHSPCSLLGTDFLEKDIVTPCSISVTVK